MGILLRDMSDADLAKIEVLEAVIFPDAWPTAAFEEHLDEREAGALVAEVEGRIVGYACYRFDCGEVHMTNLAVDPDHRRKSVAKELLGYILGLARRRDCELMLLEVRSSNETARQFYEAEGFVTVEQSPSYYDDPTEDALVMMRRIRAQQGGS